MPTFANHNNHSTSAAMSESDNDEDNEQNSSYNQHNESMMHKVKDVVSKLLHPSFLFSASADTSRSKRKRATSIEENGNEQQSESTTTATTIMNGHATTSKSKHHHQPITNDEPQLTDDEDNNSRNVSPPEQELTEIEQQKKRRRTANYQHIISTTTATTTNGNHKDERTSLPLTSTNSVGSSSNRQIIDNGLSTAHTTPVLLQTFTEQKHNEGIHRLTSSKQRFDIPSTKRALTPNYDPAQSLLFSVGVRKINETTMSPNRTSTNLKSNTNEFTANYLLATGLVNRSQASTQNIQQSSSNPPNRLLPNERQMFGVNYASINSRRLPYIERLRRRTLQDCIRLNRTLDSEPLSISTIEEHTSTVTSPMRKPMKALEKECGIQCNISTVNDSMEPSKKVQRTFPPADIRLEALSVPMNDKTQSMCQTDSVIQTNSSITIEPIQPIHDIIKPKVLGNITAFSWPRFARAQDDYAMKNPEKCRANAVSTQPSKPTVSSAIEKSSVNMTSSITTQINISSTMPKIPIFSVSPPRPTKPITGPVWRCPSCSMEHPTQTSSCSLCHGINPNYKRLSAIESTSTLSSSSSSKVPDIIIEEPTVSKSVTTTQMTVQNEFASMAKSSLSASVPTLTRESTFSIPSSSTLSSSSSTTTTTTTTTTSALFSPTGTLPLFGATNKETAVTNLPASTSVSFPSTTTLSFGTSTVNSDKSTTTTSNNLFQIGTNPTSTFPTFGTLTSTNTTASTSITPSIIATTSSLSLPATTVSSSVTFGGFSTAPRATTTSSSGSITFGGFGATAITTTSSAPITFTGFGTASTIATTSASSTVPSDKTPLFSFGANTAPSSLSTIPATTASSITPGMFAFSASTTTPATTTTTVSLTVPTPAVTTTSGLAFPSSFSSTSTPFSLTTTSAAPLFGGGLSSTPGFSFPSMGTTTTTSSSTPFAFGASSPPKTFAPSVISTGTTNPTPSFGATAAFGGPATTVDKTSTSFPTFGSTSTTPSLFAFGATSSSNPTTNPIQAPAVTATSGFSFAPTTTASSSFGSSGQTFGFGAAPSFSFGAGATSTTSNAPFQFSAVPPITANNSFSVGFPPAAPAPETNPFSVNEETTKRHVIKAKRRAK
ncbi:unnamed protein product [Rotaria socialis]|uniref:RanBP2-type domain-containing protein n=2 Tax=Rotaria socialis TaxID=392032 RepID=A0A820YV84_9BILA|nr:unnamed protein product [Rotaria socialis]CAF4548315.1 unnamed protein product [Rotaria socialis]